MFRHVVANQTNYSCIIIHVVIKWLLSYMLWCHIRSIDVHLHTFLPASKSQAICSWCPAPCGVFLELAKLLWDAQVWGLKKERSQQVMCCKKTVANSMVFDPWLSVAVWSLLNSHRLRLPWLETGSPYLKQMAMKQMSTDRKWLMEYHHVLHVYREIIFKW